MMPSLDATRPSPLRRLVTVVWGASFIAVVFVVLPWQATRINAELEWPRWQGGVGKILGGGLFTASLAVSLHCSRLFARLGQGTPVPIDPPSRLVVSGLYRYSRNPIYVAQVAVLLSYGLWFGHAALFIYALLVGLLIQLGVVALEEPQLRRRFGSSYAEYMQAVPRWVGRPSVRVKRTHAVQGNGDDGS